jgi:hypothetical protein
MQALNKALALEGDDASAVNIAADEEFAIETSA